MKGVARGVDASLDLEDLTHEIQPFDIWQGAYRLYQTAPYWPAGTVFVSVVDPGVGTPRKSIVARSRAGHYYVTPDNGTLTLIADEIGIEAVRWIDEAKLRLPGSHTSNTFHGRDVYSYVGALLASRQLTFEATGLALSPNDLERIPYQTATQVTRTDGIWHLGTIPILDPNFGNVWSNIRTDQLADIKWGSILHIRILQGEREVWSGHVPYLETFGKAKPASPLAYPNSLGNLSLALNQANFATTHQISSGPTWHIEVHPTP